MALTVTAAVSNVQGQRGSQTHSPTDKQTSGCFLSVIASNHNFIIIILGGYLTLKLSKKNIDFFRSHTVHVSSQPE